MLASNRQKYLTLTILFNTIDYLIISRDITIFVYGIFHFFPDPFFYFFCSVSLIITTLNFKHTLAFWSEYC